MFGKMYRCLNKGRWNKHLLWVVIICILAVTPLTGYSTSLATDHNQPVPTNDGLQGNFEMLEKQLESIRQALNIPGMSAAVVQDQELVWAAGFGFADIEKQVLATPDTPYELASVTKPVAAVIIMQLVEAGIIDLDSPLSEYGVNQLGGKVTVRHLLTHTSEGTPGAVHNYNGSRYGLLGGVMEGATGQTFAALLSQNIFLPLSMNNSATNPFNQWGGIRLSGLEDFTRTLGWGANYKNYPGIYARLAKPYQFDDSYNIIPGMYNLYHNPGAGMISSVTDLAKLDIALDKGILLSDDAKALMFTPAVSTYENRADLKYGLGWYVQEFESLQLLWHTGRWYPSVSALYMKIPQQNITFIVLANTDNLTVPFYGIGEGDISQSVLFLAFFRNFIFPEVYGLSLPEISWEAGENDLIEILSGVKDDASHTFLERELWSYRQVFGSSGQKDQVDKLNRVRRSVFTVSQFNSNPFYTNLPGSPLVIDPLPSISTLAVLSKVLVIWISIMLLSVVLMLLVLRQDRGNSVGRKVIWLLSAFVTGPTAVLSYRNCQARRDGRQPTRRQKAWGTAGLVTAVYTVSWALAMTLLILSGDNPNPLLILGLTYFLPLGAILFLVRFQLKAGRGIASDHQHIERPILVDLIIANLGFAIYFSLTFMVSERVLDKLPYPTSPYFWGMLLFIALISLIFQALLQYWLGERGGSLFFSDNLDAPSSSSLQPALAGTLVLVVLSVALTITQMG